MGRDTDAEANEVAELLQAWAAGDFDGFVEALDSIAQPGQELIEELRVQEGDARRIQGEIEEELERLAGLARGAMYLARHAVDLALDPPATRFISREEVIQRLLAGS
jgi:hypothetical protein